MADTENTVGREPVQIVEIRQPFCANTYGTAPCTASGGSDAKCYNTRATCQDTANFRIRPEAGLGDPTVTLYSGDAVDTSLFTTNADVFMAFDLKIPNAPDGLIYEQGGSGFGAYLGFDGGNIVFRVGGGGSGHPSTCARIEESATTLAGRMVTILAGVDYSANTATLWFFDPALRTLTEIGTDTAVSSLGVWTGSGDGGIGYVNGAVVAGENTAAFNGEITEARFYDSTSAPDMDVSFTLSLFFSTGAVAERGVSGAPYIIPSLQSVSTSPAKINLAVADGNAQGIGNRAVCNIALADHPHTDRRVDPYVSGRSWDPLARGTFWAKWMVRNKFRQNIKVIVYDGYFGQALSAMTKREYFLQEITGPDQGGRVQIKAKDVLSLIEDRKATCPKASPGILRAGITAAATSFEATGAALSDYQASGTIRIDRECITYTSVTNNGRALVFSGLVRGTDGTTAAAHSADAPVQRCVRFTEATIPTVVLELCETWGGISRTLLKEVQWATEFDTFGGSLSATRLIVDPVSVAQLLSELQEQFQFNIFWDEREGLVDLKMVRGITAEPTVFSDETGIAGDTFSQWEMPKSRISQLWVYYNQRDPTAPDDELDNFDLYVAAVPNSESYEEYGEKSIKTVYAKWINDRSTAGYFADRHIVRFADVPRGCKFRVDAKDRATWLGDVVKVSTEEILDQYGERDVRTWTVVSAEEVEPGHTIEYELHDTTVFGRVYFYMASGSADYPGAGSVGFTDAYYGDSSGELSDGNRAATYA